MPDEDAQEQDPKALSDELDEQAQALEDRSQDLGEEIEKTRSHWEAQQADPSVPGAVGGERSEAAEHAPGQTPAPGNAGSPQDVNRAGQ